jgi:5-hydroxyisourate hydrolase-like protein (transthyretin family)
MLKIINKLKNNNFKEGLILGLFLSLIFLIGFYFGAIYVFSQGQSRYTVFKTQNSGFRFKNTSGDYVPIFSKAGLFSPTSSDANLVLTSLDGENILRKQKFKITLRPDSVILTRIMVRNYNSYCFANGTGVVQNIDISGGSLVEGLVRFERSSYPSTLSFDYHDFEAKAGLLLTEIDLLNNRNGFSEKLGIFLDEVKYITFDMYTNDGGTCRILFTDGNTHSDESKYTIRGQRGRYISIVVSRNTQTYLYPEAVLPRNQFCDNNYDFYWPVLIANSGYFTYPVEISLHNRYLDRRTHIYTSMVRYLFNQGENFWYRIEAKGTVQDGQASLSYLMNFMKKAYIECRTSSGSRDRWGGAALKITLSSDKYSQ